MHAELARLNSTGTAPWLAILDKDVSSGEEIVVGRTRDGPAAVFHAIHAACCGNAEACKALKNLALGMADDGLLRDIKLDKEDVGLKAKLEEIMAQGGDPAATVAAAKVQEDAGNVAAAIRLLEPLVDTMRDETQWTMEQDADAEYTGCCKHQTLAMLGGLYHKGGPGENGAIDELVPVLNMNDRLCHAGDLYQEASDAAMARMKGRLATQYAETSELVWGEMDEE